MATYHLTPDKRGISIALNYNSIEEFDAEYPGYEVELLTNTVEWSPFDNEEEFEANFKTLLANYQIEDHYDNLMYVVLSVFDAVFTGIQHAHDDYNSKKRARELAQLLLLLKPTQTYKTNSIAFKTPTSDAKINDPILIHWITESLINSIRKFQYSPTQFGDTTHFMLNPSGQFNDQELDYSVLKEMADKRLINPKNTVKRGHFTICYTVYKYLELATTLTASKGTQFSDTQLTFLFELLQLLKQVHIETITSEPKDYMSSLMYNFIK